MGTIPKFLCLFFLIQASFLQAQDKYNNGFPEEKYDLILDEFQSHYGAIIAALGGELVIERDWSDGAVNMWAEKWGDRFILEIPGGMARYHLIIEEAFILSVCHELGHLLGGPPGNGNISYEGQSDYFAGRECIADMLTRIAPLLPLKPNTEVDQLCAASTTHDPEICRRSLRGVESLSSYYAEIIAKPFPKVSQKSQTQVSKTLTTHPEPQCRLDTFVAGFFNSPRPSCWFHE